MDSMMESINVIIKSYDTEQSKLAYELLDAMDTLVVELNRFKADRIEKFLELKEALYAFQKEPSDENLKKLLIDRKNYAEANVKYAKIFGYYNGITYSLGLIDDIQSI
jgi:phage regulator Rha-like protein